MEEGVIAKWHVKEGDHVEPGDLLFEVSTDKATVEHQALDEGWLRQIIVAEGEVAEVNQPVALFGETEEEKVEPFAPEKAPQGKEQPVEKKTEKQEQQPAKKEMAQPVFKPSPPLEGGSFQFPTEPLERVKASPVAKAIAKEQGLDLSSVKGSGPGGRIMKRDLSLAQKGSVVRFSQRERPKEDAGSFEEIPMSPMRKVIGKRLQEAKAFIPHYYVSLDVDADNLVSIREQLKEGGLKVTYNDLIIRAVALALKEHPNVNSGYNSESESIVRFKTIDISVAVDIDDGLITPIIRYADYKSVGEISAEVKELAGRAKQGKLKPEEYQGGSFTISNLGMFGVTHFHAVINPPQSAILAIGGINDQPIVKNGQLLAGKVMNMTISADHRVVDGAIAAAFLKTVKKYMENPALLVV